MTNNLLYLYAVIFGLILGSFLNVVALRDQRRKSILTGRSECPHCKHVLRWYELIPLLSYLMQGGRCRQCKKPLSWQYPVAELVTAAITVYATWFGIVQWESPLVSLALLASFSLFLVASAVDLRSMELPIDYVVVAGLIGGWIRVLAHMITWQEAALGVLAGAGSIAVILYGWKLIFKQDGMGTGDIWMAGALGAVAGYPLIFADLIFAVTAGAVVGILVLAIAKKGLNTALPFGPFLFLGLLFALIWGQTLLQWYIL